MGILSFRHLREAVKLYSILYEYGLERYYFELAEIYGVNCG